MGKHQINADQMVLLKSEQYFQKDPDHEKQLRLKTVRDWNRLRIHDN